MVIDGRIIKISSQEKENQYRPDNIIIEQWKDKYTGKDYREDQIPYFSSLKFFSIIYEYAHRLYKLDKMHLYLYYLTANFQEKFILLIILGNTYLVWKIQWKTLEKSLPQPHFIPPILHFISSTVYHFFISTVYQCNSSTLHHHKIVVKSSRDNASNLLEHNAEGISKEISDFFWIIFWIAPKVFLLNGANNSKNATKISKENARSSCLFFNWIRQLLTLGTGLKHFAGTHLRYVISHP